MEHEAQEITLLYDEMQEGGVAPQILLGDMCELAGISKEGAIEDIILRFLKAGFSAKEIEEALWRNYKQRLPQIQQYNDAISLPDKRRS